jgi:signal transduction histidine kinase
VPAFYPNVVAASESSLNKKSQGTSEPAIIYFTNNKTPDKEEKSKPPKRQIDYRYVLKKMMDEAFQVLEAIEKDKSLSLERKKQKAIEYLRNIRWGWRGREKKEFYFWVHDIQAIMIMEASLPHMEGKDLMNFEDHNGKQVFAEMIKVCRTQKQGFVMYLWPKFRGRNPHPKISIVRLFEPWEWVVGTGVHLDTIPLEYPPVEELQDIIDFDGFPFDDTRPASPI